MYEVTDELLEQFRKEHLGKKYSKLPVEVEAFQMDDDFFVDTIEGRMQGYKGDYLIVGVAGEPYPCKQEIFEETYREV